MGSLWQHHIGGLRICCSGGRVDARRLPLIMGEGEMTVGWLTVGDDGCSREEERCLNNGCIWKVEGGIIFLYNGWML